MRLLLAVGAGFLLVLLGIMVVIRNGHGEEVSRIEVPDGGTVEVRVQPKDRPAGQFQVAQLGQPAAAKPTALSPSKFFAAHEPLAEITKVAVAVGLKVGPNIVAEGGSGGINALPSASSGKKRADVMLHGSDADLVRLFDAYKALLKKQMQEQGIDEAPAENIGWMPSLHRFELDYHDHGRKGFIRALGFIDTKEMLVVDIYLYEYSAVP